MNRTHGPPRGTSTPGLGIFAQHGILVMPVLFNRWRDPVCDFGGVPLDHLIPHHSAWTGADDLFANPDAGDTEAAPVQGIFYRYLADVVGAHRDDERIYAWDLYNEPLMGSYVDDENSPVRRAELTWLTWCYRVCKDLGARQSCSTLSDRAPTRISSIPRMPCGGQ